MPETQILEGAANKVKDPIGALEWKGWGFIPKPRKLPTATNPTA